MGVRAGECVWVFLGESAGVSVSVGKEGGFGSEPRCECVCVCVCVCVCMFGAIREAEWLLKQGRRTWRARKTHLQKKKKKEGERKKERERESQ